MTPVLVRMDGPVGVTAVMDASPHVPDANGHVWRLNVDEPRSKPFCLLCCDDYGDSSTNEQCGEADLLPLVNEERARFIAEHRVEGVNA